MSELQNRNRIYISNFSNADGVPDSRPSTTTTSQPTGYVGSVGTSIPAIKLTPVTAKVTPAPVTPPPVVVAPPVIMPSGAMGGGGGGEKTGDTASGGGANNDMKIYGISGFAFLAGAIGGYFLGKKMEKSPLLFAGIGGVVLGLATYGVTTKFIYPSGEQTSGFLGFGKRRKKIDRDKNINGRYVSGNAGRKECERNGGTVVFPNSGGWYCDLKK